MSGGFGPRSVLITRGKPNRCRNHRSRGSPFPTSDDLHGRDRRRARREFPRGPGSGVDAVLERQRDALMAIEGVVMVGEGQDEIGRDAIVVGVKQHHQLKALPRAVEDVRVVGMVIGEVDALGAPADAGLRDGSSPAARTPLAQSRLARRPVVEPSVQEAGRFLVHDYVGIGKRLAHLSLDLMGNRVAPPAIPRCNSMNTSGSAPGPQIAHPLRRRVRCEGRGAQPGDHREVSRALRPSGARPEHRIQGRGVLRHRPETRVRAIGLDGFRPGLRPGVSPSYAFAWSSFDDRSRRADRPRSRRLAAGSARARPAERTDRADQCRPGRDPDHGRGDDRLARCRGAGGERARRQPDVRAAPVRDRRGDRDRGHDRAGSRPQPPCRARAQTDGAAGAVGRAGTRPARPRWCCGTSRRSCTSSARTRR